MIRRIKLSVIVVILLAVIVAFSPIVLAETAINVSPRNIFIHPEQEIVISGIGFPAEQEVTLRTEGPYGVVTDISLMAGSPTTDEQGAFVAKWELGRWANVNMAGSPGVYPLRISAGIGEVLIPIVYEE